MYGANVPMITELVNDSNVQFLDQVNYYFFSVVVVVLLTMLFSCIGMRYKKEEGCLKILASPHDG